MRSWRFHASYKSSGFLLLWIKLRRWWFLGWDKSISAPRRGENSLLWFHSCRRRRLCRRSEEFIGRFLVLKGYLKMRIGSSGNRILAQNCDSIGVNVVENDSSNHSSSVFVVSHSILHAIPHIFFFFKIRLSYFPFILSSFLSLSFWNCFWAGVGFGRSGAWAGSALFAHWLIGAAPSLLNINSLRSSKSTTPKINHTRERPKTIWSRRRFKLRARYNGQSRIQEFWKLEKTNVPKKKWLLRKKEMSKNSEIELLKTIIAAGLDEGKRLKNQLINYSYYKLK